MIKAGKSSYSKRYLLLCCILFLSVSGLTGQSNIYGIAKKKNIKKHGMVISYEPMKSVVLECQGDTLTFDLDEYKFRFTTRKAPKKYNFPDGVYYHRIALGILPGNPGDGGYINYTYHYQKNRLLGYGGGVSFENYGDVDGYDFIVPSVALYSYFSAKNRSPFLRFTTGYGIAIKNTSKFQTQASGGLNLGAAIGMRLSTNRIMIDFTAGARFQKGYYEFDFGDFSKISDIQFQRFDFSVGFMW